jgi:hypothetical protein
MAITTESAEMQCRIYGLDVRVSGDWPEVVEALRRDFAWFPRGTGEADVNVQVRRRPPDLTRFGALEARDVTWKSTAYRDGGTTITDYLGQAVSVDDGAGTFTIDGVQGWLVWRACYEYLLRASGPQLDRLGLARVNGLGLAGDRGGALVILESGGGKTTLALSALAAGRRLVSEGSPLLDGAGRLHPFPVPLLVRGNSEEAASLPEEHVRRLPGIDPDPLSLEVSAFADLVPREPVPLHNVVFAARSLATAPELTPVPWRRVLVPMGRATVGGHGLFQGGGNGSTPARAWAARKRPSALVAALRAAQAWRLRLSLDKEANWSALDRLL